MINWTDEALRAETEYRRQWLHDLAVRGTRGGLPRRQPAWWAWLHRGLRH